MYSSNAFFCSSKTIAVQQRRLNDLLAVSGGDAEGIIPPICALCMNWANAERRADSDVCMTAHGIAAHFGTPMFSPYGKPAKFCRVIAITLACEATD
jgi:hypothetical protein